MKFLASALLSSLISGCSLTPSSPVSILETKIAKSPSPQDKMEFETCLNKVSAMSILAKYHPQGQVRKELRSLVTNSPERYCRHYRKDYLRFSEVHHKKVGVIMVGSEKEKSRPLKAGILFNQHQSDTNHFIFKNASLNKDDILKSLATLYFDKKISSLIAWGDGAGLEIIRMIQDGLDLSTIYLSKDELRSSNENLYRLYPQLDRHIEALISSMKQKNIRRLAILSQEEKKGSLFFKKFQRALQKSGIAISHHATYSPDDFFSMDQACQKIFNVNHSQRRSELLQIRNRQRMKARRQGLKLNPRMVFLPGQVNFDAIFVPDNFKVMRHFVKIFKFYKIPRTPLIGMNQWRAPSLLEPREDFLDGSFFVDFIGEYSKLPRAIRHNFQIDHSKLDPLTMANIDHSMIGYYAGLISRTASARGKYRSQVNELFSKIEIKDGFLGRRVAFGDDHQFNWPTFTLEIQDNELKVSSRH
jgi:hypothetical protein